MPSTKQHIVRELRGTPMLHQIAATSAQVALLWLMSLTGHEIVALIHLPLRFVEQGAGLLVRNLPLFFVPLAVGFAVTGRVAQLVTSLQGKAAIAIRSSHVETHLDRR
jgi:putative effector of murein hydrolase LrgA (UPF0299 family)